MDKLGLFQIAGYLEYIISLLQKRFRKDIRLHYSRKHTERVFLLWLLVCEVDKIC